MTAAFDAQALAISTAVFDSIWEGAILFGAVWLALRIISTLGAATRYCVWLCTLLAFILVPVVTVALSSHRTAEAPLASTLSVPVAASDRSDRSGVSTTAAELPRKAAAPQAPPSNPPHTARITLSRAIVLGIAILWLLAAAVRAVVFAWNFRQLSRLRSTARLWRSSYELPVWVSDSASVPLAVGFIRRGVILPTSLIESESADALDAIVLHEIAHLRRYDVWTNALARLAEIFLVLNPLARLVARELATEREIACDDVVVAELGSGRTFAQALAALAMSDRRGGPIAAPSAMGSPHSIVVRIERLLDAHPRTIRLSFSTLGGALMFLALIAMLMQTISPVLAYAPQHTAPPNREVAAACAVPDRPVQMKGYVDTSHGRKTFWHAPFPLSTAIYPGKNNVAIVDVTVDALGKVQKVAVVSSPDAKGAQYAARQFKRIQYRPAVKNCVAVTSSFRTWYPVLSAQAGIYSIVSPVYPRGWSAQNPESCRVPDLIHGGVPSLSGVTSDKALSATVRVNVASSGAVTDAAIADSSGNTAFDNATLAAARSKTYPLNEGTGFKPVRPNGADLSWNATHGYSRFSKCSPLPDEYVWTATFKPAGSPILGH